MQAPPFPDTTTLFGCDGKIEAVISAATAKRMLKRNIAEIVMDGAKIAGVVRHGFGLKKNEDGEYHVPGSRDSSTGVKIQRFDNSPHWCYQLIDPSTGEAVA